MSKTMNRKVGKYDFLYFVGDGNYGRVELFLDTESVNWTPSIITMTKRERMRCDEYVQSDIQKLQALSHPNVVGLVQVMTSSTRLFVISEYAAGGELYDALEEYEECRFPEEIARFYFRQLVSGLAHCHRYNVYHGDLQGDNLLLDGVGNLKVSRVGMKNVKHQQTDEVLEHCLYMAPESEQECVNGPKTDSWSIGVILFYLLTGEHPFDEPSMVGLCLKIMKASYEFPPWVNIEAQSCVSRLLTVDATERASLEEIASHPWVMGGESNRSPEGAIFSPCVEPAPLLDFVRRQLSDSECGVPPPTEGIHSQRVLQIYRWAHRKHFLLFLYQYGFQRLTTSSATDTTLILSQPESPQTESLRTQSSTIKVLSNIDLCRLIISFYVA